MLKIENLSVKLEEKVVLKNIDLTVEKGEIHVIFGPNGSGKTTLLKTILGFPYCKVINGRIIFENEDITKEPMYERVKRGIFLLFQNPPKLRFVKLNNLLSFEIFDKNKIKNFLEFLKLSHLSNRYTYVNFSGGEIKKVELLQMLATDAKLVLIDEIDSGIDLESLKTIGNILKDYLKGKSAIIITHTGLILDYIKADLGHIMLDGKIVFSGDPYNILNKIREFGYKKWR